MRKEIWIIIGMIFCAITVGLTSLNFTKQTISEPLAIKEIILPYFCDGVVEVPKNIKVTYLPEISENNYKITVRFNKRLSEKNDRTMAFVQVGHFAPIVSMSKELPDNIPFQRYQIKDNTIEFSSNMWEQNEYYVNPMKFSALFLNKEIMSEDGSKLDQDQALYFSLGVKSPHMQLEQINEVMKENVTPTIIIPMLSKENSLWYPNTVSRNVGYVIKTSSKIFHDEALSECMDELSFGANVEIVEAKDNSYKVNYYIPRAYDDPKHHSKYVLSADIDIFESDYLIKKQGYIKAENIGIIEPFDNQGCKISVYATGACTEAGTLELYVRNEFYPYSTNGSRDSVYRLYECLDEKEVRSDEVSKKITTKQIDALEMKGYMNLYEIFDNEYGVGQYDENNQPIPMDDKRTHIIMLKYFKEDRDLAVRLTNAYYDYLFTVWDKSAGCKAGEVYKTEYHSFFENFRKLVEVYFDWNKMDPEVNRNTLVQLLIERFGSTQEEKEKIRKLFEDQDKSLQEQYFEFYDEVIWININKIEKEISDNVKYVFK